MNSIWHSHFFSHWRAGWRLFSILAGITSACLVPVYLLGIIVAAFFPQQQQERAAGVAYLLYFITVFPYLYHRLMSRLGFGVLDMLRPPSSNVSPKAKSGSA